MTCVAGRIRSPARLLGMAKTRPECFETKRPLARRPQLLRPAIQDCPPVTEQLLFMRGCGFMRRG